MVSRIKSGVVFYVVALGVIAAFHSHTAYAQNDAIVSGGQICQPTMSNSDGSIVWRAAGVLNVGDETRGVVCPVVFSTAANNFDVSVTLANRSDVEVPAGDFVCVLTISDLFGDPVVEEELPSDEPTPPGGSFILGFVDFTALDTQSASVSCQLPPGTGVVRVVQDIL